MAMIAALCSSKCPVGYNYRYCAAATEVFLILRLSNKHKRTRSCWEKPTCHTHTEAWLRLAVGARRSKRRNSFSMQLNSFFIILSVDNKCIVHLPTSSIYVLFPLSSLLNWSRVRTVCACVITACTACACYSARTFSLIINSEGCCFLLCAAGCVLGLLLY